MNSASDQNALPPDKSENASSENPEPATAGNALKPAPDDYSLALKETPDERADRRSKANAEMQKRYRAWKRANTKAP